MKKLYQDIRIAAAIVLLSAIVGIGLNFVRPDPLPWTHETKAARLAKARALEESLGQRQNISADILENLIRENSNIVILDARPKLFFEEGHIAGAFNLTPEKFQKQYPPLAARLTKASRIIVYCTNADCPLSEQLNEPLRERGHQNITHYLGGWEEWEMQKRKSSKGSPNP